MGLKREFRVDLKAEVFKWINILKRYSIINNNIQIKDVRWQRHDPSILQDFLLFIVSIFYDTISEPK